MKDSFKFAGKNYSKIVLFTFYLSIFTSFFIAEFTYNFMWALLFIVFSIISYEDFASSERTRKRNNREALKTLKELSKELEVEI
ncbi:MAG: hypothetical protein ACP5N3_04145 [Candidatus Nanoarchaeia archaeon]